MSVSAYALPTVGECKNFLAAVNVLRTANGLEALDKIEYDKCVPMSSTRCLSATNCYVPINEDVSVGGFEIYWEDDFGIRHQQDIPDDILLVTQKFDRMSEMEDSEMVYYREALRNRFEEAGILI